MLTSKDLNALGVPQDSRVMPTAMRIANIAAARGADLEQLRENIRALANDPAPMREDPLWGELATALAEFFPEEPVFVPRETPAPWEQWGDVHVEEDAIRQMQNACALPNAMRGALMPDAHAGYGLPIGGVLAVKDAVIPYAVGVDIACRMRLSVLDMPVSSLESCRDTLVAALEKETRFGMGAAFTQEQRREHMVMDEDWSVSPVTLKLKDKAWKQLGTSGGGNHFAEFGELHVEETAHINGRVLEKGVRLALLSHSGSRGTGETVATHYSQRAMDLRSGLPQTIKHLAWLELNSADGEEYWNAMELMGRYASANHELIHRHVLRALGAEATVFVENHHNFAWKEEYNGESVVVHRKGATPAHPGALGVVPGSMGSPGFVVRGKGCENALNSCSHGAGRLMSRAAAFKTLDREAVRAYLAERGVHLISGGLDEAPMAYKDINAVMAAQSDLVDVLARFEPRLVKMAPDNFRQKKKKKRW